MEKALIDLEFKVWKEKFEHQQDLFYEKIETLIKQEEFSNAHQLLESRYGKIKAILEGTPFSRKTAYFEADHEENWGYLLLVRSKMGLEIGEDLELLKAENEEDPLLPRIEESLRFHALQSTALCDLVIVFDATLSQAPYWDQMKASITQIVDHVTSFSKGIRIAVVAYRDYCDKDDLVEIQPFTGNAEKLIRFAAKIRCLGGGGNGGEAIEVGLNEAIKLLKSSDAHSRLIVLIGDEPAHGVLNKLPGKMNYITETNVIKSMKVPIYTVNTLEYDFQKVRDHYQWYARETGGHGLLLKNIGDLGEIITLMIGKATGNLTAAHRLLTRESPDDEKLKRINHYHLLLE
ncbi:MAG: VWA domain-containing protein [SAR324 cluster bacterium]|nr:VWA domain-containing protein [SAR324 cluster bacterium]